MRLTGLSRYLLSRKFSITNQKRIQLHHLTGGKCVLERCIDALLSRRVRQMM